MSRRFRWRSYNRADGIHCREIDGGFGFVISRNISA